MSLTLTRVLLSSCLISLPTGEELYPQQTGSIRGAVYAADETPINAVEIVAVNSASKGVSDSSGRFFLSGLPSGENLIFVRRLGYEPISFSVVVPADSTVWMAMHLRSVPTSLPNVVTTAASSERLTAVGFAERQRNLKGVFLTRADIQRMGSLRVGDLLQGLPRITVRRVGPRSSVIFGGTGCVMRVLVDGAPIMVSQSPPYRMLLDDVVSPAMIEGMEVYVGASDTPMQFAGIAQACGTIVIWTRR
jgi:hypothetical protein